MACRLTTARGVLTILIATLAAGSAAASPGARVGAVPDPIVFPVVGPYRYTNDFGDPRPQGRHEGNDVLSRPILLISVPAMSALGHKRTFAAQNDVR